MIDIVDREVLTAARYREIVQLCLRAYGEDLEDVLEDCPGSTHVMLVDQSGALISHALWVERELIYGERSLRSAYVELVATDPDHRHRGCASTVMRALGKAIADFDIGALAPSDPSFYAPFGWRCWRGPLFEQRENGEIVRSPDNESVMVLPTPRGPTLDLDLPLTAPWRLGEIW